MSSDILTQQDGPILRITLNQPERGNAVTDEMVVELTGLIAEAPKNSDIVVLRGAGKDFCVGRFGMGSRPAVEPTAYARRNFSDVIFDAYGAMRNCPIPIVAVVQGGAHGFGCAIAAACDVTLASDVAKFSVPSIFSIIYADDGDVPVRRPRAAQGDGLSGLLDGRGQRRARPLLWHRQRRVSGGAARRRGRQPHQGDAEGAVDLNPAAPRNTSAPRPTCRPPARSRCAQPARHHQLRCRNQTSSARASSLLFDLLPYEKHFDQYKATGPALSAAGRSPFRSGGRRAQPIRGHLEVWKEMDRLGYDGVGLNEHHTTPHGLMNSPNMMAAVGAQHTKNLKFLLLGNLLPLHNPLRIAEELAMADCLSRGRVLAGFARGVPREYKVYDVPMSESRARFEEAYDIILKAWTQETFSHQGKFWSFKDIAIWPRPYQQPHPPVWVPFTGSKETIEWAGKHNLNAVIPRHPARAHRGHRTATSRSQLAKHGHRITSDQLCLFTDAWVSESKAKAIEEYMPYYLYFTQVLWHHGSLDKDGKRRRRSAGRRARPTTTCGRRTGPLPSSTAPEIRQMNLADVEKRVMSNQLAWGSAKEVTELLIDDAEHAGANSLLLNINLGAMPRCVPRADPPFRARGAAEAAGTSGDAGSRRGVTTALLTSP